MREEVCFFSLNMQYWDCKHNVWVGEEQGCNIPMLLAYDCQNWWDGDWTKECMPAQISC